MTKRENLFLITSISYIVYVLFPLFADLTGIPIQIPSLMTFVILFALYPLAFVNKPTFWFLCYALILFTYLTFLKPLTVGIGTVHDSKKIIIELAFILPNLSIFNVLVYLKNKDLFRTLFRASIIILISSFVYILPALIMNENVLRLAEAGLAEIGDVKGLPSYTLMHAYTMISPMLLYGIKVTKGKDRKQIILASILTLYVIFNTFVTTSLILLVFVGIFTLIYKENNKFKTLLGSFSVCGIIFFVLKSGIMIGALDTIEPVFENTAVEPKIIDLKASLLAGEAKGSTITGRSSFHDMSIRSFIANPITGSSDSQDIPGRAGKVGGHSSILDRFGGMGILGGTPFIMIFVSSFLIIRKYLETEKSKFYYLLAMGVIGCFLYVKGLFGNEGWLMSLVILPMGIMYFQYFHELEDKTE